MIVSRVQRVANPSRKDRTRGRTIRRKSVGNPAHMLTLGFLNPHKERSKMPKKAKRKNTSKARRTYKSKPRRISKMSNPRRKNSFTPKHRRRKNPKGGFSFFGGPARPGKVLEASLGVLVGVAVNKTVVALLPASLTGSSVAATVASFGVAVGQWWLASMISPDFGTAVGLGGIANAGSVALNAFIPSVGGYVSLSGMPRGMGDFVPGLFAVPENPVTRGANNANITLTGNLGASAYGTAYGRRAA